LDPNANLEELRSLTASLLEQIDNEEPIDQDDAARVLELFEALDGWISRGGFLPRAWKR
jgi:hypothetical protein